MALTPLRPRLRPDVATFLRPLDEPTPAECGEHDACCALVQQWALTIRVGVAGETEESVVGIITARGHR